MSADTQPANPGADAAPSPALNRRQLLARLSVLLGGVGAALVGVPVVGFLVGPLLRRTGEFWQPIGPASDFTVGQTVRVTFTDPSSLQWAGVAASTAAWLRRESEQEFSALAVNCTHLGCPVRWQPDAQLFMCPCHGGAFYKDGAVASGPPPRPLPRYQVRVRDGQVEIYAGPTPSAG